MVNVKTIQIIINQTIVTIIIYEVVNKIDLLVVVYHKAVHSHHHHIIIIKDRKDITMNQVHRQVKTLGNQAVAALLLLVVVVVAAELPIYLAVKEETRQDNSQILNIQIIIDRQPVVDDRVVLTDLVVRDDRTIRTIRTEQRKNFHI